VREAEALAWLYRLADQERGVGWNPRASPDAQWKLGRTRALLDLAGSPDRRLRVVLVAGTKGKGSTCAMLASIIGAAGVRCGLDTKPHLQVYRERVRVDGRAISPADFNDAVARMRRLVPELPPRAGEPTTFEVTTALALDYFARAECDVAVVEVGLGGRLDATNATDPYLSVITSISYDHTAILGHRLGAIAAEKAGILRAGRCALLAAQRPAVMKALQRACRDVGAQCRVVRPVERTIPLAGAHQWQNAALAIAAARVLVPKITDGSIQRGLQRLRWPGRFEIIGEAPPVVLDGAHNGASAEALANTLEHYTAGRPLDLVVGINRDKDARAVLRPLVGLAQRVWATQTANNVRALPADELARRCQRLGAPAESVPNVEAALDQAMRNTSGVVCVTGSLMLVGQARATLGVPAPEQLW
jgi:dihydrofolate synthase/folylpolyglutamate synthase